MVARLSVSLAQHSSPAHFLLQSKEWEEAQWKQVGRQTEVGAPCQTAARGQHLRWPCRWVAWLFSHAHGLCLSFFFKKRAQTSSLVKAPPPFPPGDSDALANLLRSPREHAGSKRFA